MTSPKQQTINAFKKYSSRCLPAAVVCHAALLEKLAFDGVWWVRYRAAENPNTLMSTLEKLKNNKRSGVQGTASHSIDELNKLNGKLK